VLSEPIQRGLESIGEERYLLRRDDVLRRRYRVEAHLGRGAMADVYLAFDLKRQVRVAVKVLREDLALSSEFLRRFRREAQALARLEHPHIVRFYSFEQHNHVAFIVMDYVRGVTLQRHLAEAKGPLALEAATRILHEVGSALQYAHKEGYIHRDIKAGNILIREDGTAFLSDFGIARAVVSATMTLFPAGTPAYMSPEQIVGQEIDHRADIYSLGVVLYEMVTGRRPFARQEERPDAVNRLRYALLHLAPADPLTFNRSLTPEAGQVILRALSKAPSARWPDVNSMIRAWEGAVAGKHRGGGARWVHRSSRSQPRRVRAIPIAGVVLILLIVVLLKVVLFGGSPDTTPTPVNAIAAGTSSDRGPIAESSTTPSPSPTVARPVTKGAVGRSQSATASTITPTVPSRKPVSRASYAVVNKGRAPLRSGPGVDRAVDAFYDAGTRVEVRGRSEDGLWLFVRPSDGSEGWMPLTALQYAEDVLRLDVVPEAPGQTPTATPVNVTVTAVPTFTPTMTFSPIPMRTPTPEASPLPNATDMIAPPAPTDKATAPPTPTPVPPSSPTSTPLPPHPTPTPVPPREPSTATPVPPPAPPPTPTKCPPRSPTC